ncbi:hypothetical protein GR183_00965 [Stappia sp. GBMRC 2046]|uniref:Uncharacterized protein n=1 Tax=Stappia sediminis TaxID=2692190 RepID=A0A7X3LQX3_9HYPH|nr:hypothetical protein [Stappia sediminis]MXN63461.1 hypothetical protein [Stappia sediminis]
MSWSLLWVDHWSGDKDALSNGSPSGHVRRQRGKRRPTALSDNASDTTAAESSPSLDQAHDALERIAQYQQPE